MSAANRTSRKPASYGLLFLCFSIAVELGLILKLNHGLFVYTLDDPYIHLALAKNLQHGHYGINLNELSAPSSSIIWPFLLIPFADFIYAPLIINGLISLITVFLLYKILDCVFVVADQAIRNSVLTIALIAAILATNTLGLIFLGMEHSLQLMLTLAALYGLIVEANTDRVPLWLLAALYLGPLVRYENLAISAAALLYLVQEKHIKPALVVAGLLAVSIGGFSIFLKSLGLGWLPTSVIIKSASGGIQGIDAIVHNTIASLAGRQPLLIWLCIFLLLGYISFAHPKPKQLHLAQGTLLAAIFHICFGQYGWYNRYEIYIWSYGLFTLLYLFKDAIQAALATESRSTSSRLSMFVLVSSSIICAPYTLVLTSMPVASNNIYEQQYQMHRFAVRYNRPVAVNDIGYVSYDNPNYVLDLWGLSSIQAYQRRISAPDGHWMQELAQQANANLIMIYDKWLPNKPDTWIKLGELRLGKEQVSPAFASVSFYATSASAADEIRSLLREFVPTLPAGVEFSFAEP